MLRVPISKPAGWFSGKEPFDKLITVGASLTFRIVIVKTSSTDNPPRSVERTRMFITGVVSKSIGRLTSTSPLTIVNELLWVLPAPATNR